ncbi:response regulator [Variovorax sp. NFACC27]|uniref:response regulator n=1 Tax=unclassified Variovorax TaxID=663243 RepID=UPI000897B1DA|nr:DNA-binding NarL/FixJ family response regulator [Variovorax paradoxus]SEF34039.1 Response regulator receiver domain-containing protein [Variovorax sp. NFACC28]SEG98487.1 Response regulator receiver domain-containing protein [Variovorax sp. NFACC29]SFE10849.1 Response regulator receiver domain-containing protein [Variovorax sp. NFACC26]SFH16428.1 Response regulator receiver domain-containing protein [Variovorax sp. NFACC27]
MRGLHFPAGASRPSRPQLFFGALVVESDPVVASRMKRILGHLAPERRVVLAPTCEEAEAMLASLPFDLVFVDMQLYPIGQGAALIGDVRAKLPRAQVIAMSDTDERELVLSAFASGATGYLLSDAEDADIAFALRALATGTVLDPRAAGHLLDLIAETLATPERAAAGLREESGFGACRKLELRPRSQAAADEMRRSLPD